MGQHVRIAFVLGALALGACGRKPPRAEPLPEAPHLRVAARPALADLHNRDGSIKGSGMLVEWLEVPAGFTHNKERSSDAHEVYESDVLPFEGVCDFLSKRMFTGKVDLGPYRARYPAVIPLDMNESAARLNVAVDQVKGKITLDIERLPRPSEVKPLSEDEARELLSKEAERMH